MRKIGKAACANILGSFLEVLHTTHAVEYRV